MANAPNLGRLRAIEMRIAVVETRWIEVDDEAMKRIQKAKKNNLCVGCMQPLDPDKKPIRGMHFRCYQATLRAINAGEFTMKQRLEQGKILEKEPVGRKRSNPVSKEASA